MRFVYCFTIIGFICLSLIYSCKKQTVKNKYKVTYTVYYYSQTDSYKAKATFKLYDGGYVKLSGDEWVLFNDRRTENAGNYTWAGKGRGDAIFLMHKNGRDYRSSISASELAHYELDMPDTVFFTKGFKVKIKNYKPSIWSDFHFSPYGNPAGFGDVVSGDSMYFSPQTMQQYFTEGKWTLQVTPQTLKVLSLDASDIGTMVYGDVAEKNFEVEK